MEIKITKSARVCNATGRPFVHEEPCVSVLRVQEGLLLREDYAQSAWDEAFRAGAYSVWTTTYYDPEVAEAEPPEVFSPLRQLFYESVEAEDRADLARAFLAAQLLRRQKVFRLVKESDEPEGEARLSLYADRIGNRLIEVRDPNFSYAELETGRKRLLTRLQELEHPEEPPAETAEAGETAAAPASDDESIEHVESAEKPVLL